MDLPTNGTAYIYYPKGALAGLMLDILVRDASDNALSLDDVMREVYERSYLEGEGFTEAEWWEGVREAAGGRSFDEFHDAYVDGREPYPWDEVLPLAGLRLRVESERVPRVGITWAPGDGGVQVIAVAPGSAAAEAGVQAGDLLVSVAGLDGGDADWGTLFRARFEGEAEGTPYPVVVQRAGQRLELEARLRFAELTTRFLEVDPAAGEKAVRIREGILTGSTGA